MALVEQVEVGRRAGVQARSGSRRGLPCSIAANARYGFAVGSGQRNSIRFAFGDDEYIGIRMHGRAVALRVDEVHGRLVAGHEPAVRVRRRRAEREQRRRVREQAADVAAGESRDSPA